MVFVSKRSLRRGSIPLFPIKNGHNGQKLWHFKVFSPQQRISRFLKVWLIQTNADQCKILRQTPKMIPIGYITHRKCYYVNFWEHLSNCISHSYGCAGINFPAKSDAVLFSKLWVLIKVLFIFWFWIKQSSTSRFDSTFFH